MTAKKKKVAIEPLDRRRCQGERRKVNFLTLGGGSCNDPNNTVRCKNSPDWAAYEIKYKRGQQGRMSMCQKCREIFQRQDPDRAKNVRFTRIQHRGASRRKVTL